MAGLAVVVLLIPVNRWLATKIEAASERMMAHKDARLQLMGELLRGIHQVKLSAWELRFITKVIGYCPVCTGIRLHRMYRHLVALHCAQRCPEVNGCAWFMH